MDLGLVRALSESVVYQVGVSSSSACDSLQVVRPFSTEVYSLTRLWGAVVVELGRNSEETKNTPQLIVGASLADSYSSPQATTAR